MEIAFNQLPEKVVVNGKFSQNCILILSEKSFDAIRKDRLRIVFNKMGGRETLQCCIFEIHAVRGNITISCGNDGARVFFGQGSYGRYHITLWRKCFVNIGAKTSSNGIRIFCADSEFITGEDCMFSDDVLIQSSDQHGIVNLENNEIINNRYRSVLLGNHVWLGRSCRLMPDISISDGCIVASGAVVTRDVNSNSIVAGSPAKVIKENHSWSRYHDKLDDYYG